MQSLPVLTIEAAQDLMDCLEDFLEKSEAALALLIDRGGTILSQQGKVESTADMTVLAALAAGGFAANRELAIRVGEHDFNALYQQGDKFHVLTNAVDDDVLMVTIFGSQTTVGLVRFYSGGATKRIAGVLDAARNNQSIDPEFSAELARAARSLT